MNISRTALAAVFHLPFSFDNQFLSETAANAVRLIVWEKPRAKGDNWFRLLKSGLRRKIAATCKLNPNVLVP
ncbi:hypothetical protein M4951_10815 [Blastopirellula sp. J2-11]|uniref:hypothetical protein n=1 Tax=Blastopirellula sp. J2-11 TaxID=2943192 RepID=UPI0021C8CDF8|nr:hypothetical protein [Blastopirellula sp. J2-11]UUO08782.1 hypothetical protein M4951_10815 [Blastopirellula sp. J2-11]